MGTRIIYLFVYLLLLLAFGTIAYFEAKEDRLTPYEKWGG